MGCQKRWCLPDCKEYIDKKIVICCKIGNGSLHTKLIKLQDPAMFDCIQQNIGIINCVGDVSICEDDCAEKQDRGKNQHLCDTKEIPPCPVYI